ncbi:hypothetical protein [uncultured Muribaculum sp.]|uniref:hypothetical protein n=1 Tax=uncultured Muribaculum sp. TaxID=1918613 RepID=UPI0025CC889D|nr:hypothetical protein [uncultured Muribaculum sp.]
MNAYIIVEGDKTETIVYPKWLEILAPALTRVSDVFDMHENNYYLFSGGGIPSIYNHIANAIEDINNINAKGTAIIDFLIVCIDTEEESREYILGQIDKKLTERNIPLSSFNLVVFEQKVSMESWFLGNRRIFKSNPEDEALRRYISHFNVKENDPELMDNINPDEFSTKAQFHHSYLRKIFSEQHVRYSKRQPGEVCKKHYLDRLVERYNETGHIATFGRWYSFVMDNLR